MSAGTARCVEPEWLDRLDPGDARAERSRRDLVRVNALMSNAGVVAAELARAASPAPACWAEVGAGDGRFALAVAARLPPPPEGARVALVDRASLVCESTRRALATRGWRAEVAEADVFDWLAHAGTPRFDAIVANLFLHHFEAEPLARLLAAIASRTRAFVACEPRRSNLALLGSRMLGLVGCGEVTRHDAVVSVRAGFRDGELSALWPRDRAWRLAEEPRGLFSHAFVAVRS